MLSGVTNEVAVVIGSAMSSVLSSRLRSTWLQ